jgi:hypothetical protein
VTFVLRFLLFSLYSDLDISPVFFRWVDFDQVTNQFLVSFLIELQANTGGWSIEVSFLVISGEIDSGLNFALFLTLSHDSHDNISFLFVFEPAHGIELFLEALFLLGKLGMDFRFSLQVVFVIDVS